MSYTPIELIEKNLQDVMNEKDALKRRKAIENIYAEDSSFVEENEVATGYDAISTLIEGVIKKMPVDFVFKMTEPVSENHDVGRLSWSVGPVEGPAAVTGMDIVLLKDNQIQALYVFLNKNAV